ncbi:MAG: hypothetical protein EA369_07165 [Bradymonadales bacterium]|nr:MAG: hypothetical protein EA369_07165 [Bradymonadales bacterium]
MIRPLFIFVILSLAWGVFLEAAFAREPISCPHRGKYLTEDEQTVVSLFTNPPTNLEDRLQALIDSYSSNPKAWPVFYDSVMVTIYTHQGVNEAFLKNRVEFSHRLHKVFEMLNGKNDELEERRRKRNTNPAIYLGVGAGGALAGAFFFGLYHLNHRRSGADQPPLRRTLGRGAAWSAGAGVCALAVTAIGLHATSPDSVVPQTPESVEAAHKNFRGGDAPYLPPHLEALRRPAGTASERFPRR